MLSLATSQEVGSTHTHNKGAAPCHCLQQTVLQVDTANNAVNLTQGNCAMHGICNAHLPAQVLHKARHKRLWFWACS
jgi:hypothetical protein